MAPVMVECHISLSLETFLLIQKPLHHMRRAVPFRPFLGRQVSAPAPAPQLPTLYSPIVNTRLFPLAFSRSFSTETPTNEDDIIYDETPDPTNSTRPKSVHAHKLSEFKFPQDVLIYSTKSDAKLPPEDLAHALRCLVGTAIKFYGGGKRKGDGAEGRESEGRESKKSPYWDPSSKSWQLGVRKILSDRRFGILLTTITRSIDRLKPHDLIDCIHSLSKTSSSLLFKSLKYLNH